ncbi:MAG TPA: lipid-binding SYLF domain-containing protein [Steroidobacteraceae bacterium]|jgi:lipid-binding SYLF domain-containing protein|nr:lipid-binding SYLF domain-containing protein [Steroidobacteraceae bacterium]
MKRTPWLPTLLCLAALSLSAIPVLAQDSAPAREDARLVTATEVLDMLRATPDQNIPTWLMQRAYGVAVIPDVLKGAFLFGGRYGNGALTVRNAQGRFSDPIFITLAGGSVGWQIGATSTDVVLVFVTQRSVQNFARGKFTLGVDASVAAGPLGRQGEAAAGVNAEIYSYSRSRGLFAGVALDGTVLAFDRGANRAFYGDRPVTSDMITSGQVSTSDESARRFLAAVVADTGGASAPDPTQTAGVAPPTAAAVPPSPPADNATHTYPLQDNHPGSEPQP